LDAELQPIAAGSRYYAPYTELKLNEGETVGSGLLRFDIVDSDWILGLWFWMKPATWEVEVKVGPYLYVPETGIIYMILSDRSLYQREAYKRQLA